MRKFLKQHQQQSAVKQFLLGRKFSLQTYHKHLNYLCAPCKETHKTASARFTKGAKSLMESDFQLKNTLGEQKPHVDAISRLDFGDNVDNH